MHISWARLASFCYLGFISDPLIVSKFHNETYDPKGQENKIYTKVSFENDRLHFVLFQENTDFEFLDKDETFLYSQTLDNFRDYMAGFDIEGIWHHAMLVSG